MYSYKTGLGQVWVGSKLPPDPANNIIWLRPSDDHRVLWEIRTYNIYKERWEVLTSAALTAEGLLVLIRDLEKDVKSLQELKVVLYDTVQDLTPEQQQIARQNIGAISLEDLPPQVEIVQEVGSSTTAVMSQNAVTEELSKKASPESVTESISVHNTSTIAHADIRELLNTCVGLPAYDSSSYKITFTTLAGASVEIDLPIEQLALRYNAETESIEFDNADGTTTSIPVSAFVKEYVGSIGDRIQVSIDENNVIHATVLKNSIDWDCLSFELQGRINDHVTSADFATKAVRTDIAQTLSTEAQNQALENIGADLMIIDLVNGQAVLTEEQDARLLSCKGVILRGTVNASNEVLTKIYFSDYQGGDVVSFYAVQSYVSCLRCTYTKSTKIFKFIGGVGWSNPAYVSTSSSQNFSASAQDMALSNIGLDFVHVDYSLFGTTLSDADFNRIWNAKGLIILGNDGIPEIFIKGNHGPTKSEFYSFNDLISFKYIILSASYKSLSISAQAFILGAVLYNKNQPLTDTQKDTALSNIGLDFINVDYSLLGTTLDDSMAALIENAKGIILLNSPDNNRPVIWTRGNFTHNYIYFNSWVVWDTVGSIMFNVSTKRLSNISNGQLVPNCIKYDTVQSLTDAQKQQARSNMGAARGQDIQNITGSAPTLSIVGGVTYVCGELTTLTVDSIEDSTDESWVYFTSGSTPTVVTWPTGANIAGDTTIIPNASYEVCIRKSRIIIVHYEQS